MARVTPAFIRLLESSGGRSKKSIITFRYLTEVEIAIVIGLGICSANLSGFRNETPQFDTVVLEWRTGFVFNVSC